MKCLWNERSSCCCWGEDDDPDDLSLEELLLEEIGAIIGGAEKAAIRLIVDTHSSISCLDLITYKTLHYPILQPLFETN